MAESDRAGRTGGLTRRRFLQVTGAAGVGAFLAACAGGTGTTEPSATDTAGAASHPHAAAGQRRPRPCRRRRRPSRAPQVRQLGRLHRPHGRARRSTAPVDPRSSIPDEVRHPGRLRGEDRRQHVVPRHDHAGPLGRGADGLGPHRDDRLVRRAAHQQGLGGAVRPRQHAQLRGQPARPLLQEPAWDADNDYHSPGSRA